MPPICIDCENDLYGHPKIAIVNPATGAIETHCFYCAKETIATMAEIFEEIESQNSKEIEEARIIHQKYLYEKADYEKSCGTNPWLLMGITGLIGVAIGPLGAIIGGILILIIESRDRKSIIEAWGRTHPEPIIPGKINYTNRWNTLHWPMPPDGSQLPPGRFFQDFICKREDTYAKNAMPTRRLKT